jgi:hypothetical protein
LKKAAQKLLRRWAMGVVAGKAGNTSVMQASLTPK